MPVSSIQIDAVTRKRLAALKSSRRETYDEVLNKLMRLVPEGDADGRFRPGFRAKILEGALDVAEGRTVPHEEVKKRLGI
jgi:hypothetical protein